MAKTKFTSHKNHIYQHIQPSKPSQDWADQSCKCNIIVWYNLKRKTKNLKAMHSTEPDIIKNLFNYTLTHLSKHRLNSIDHLIQ